MKKNVEVRKMAQQSKVYLYEIADALGVSKPTFNRWLRKEMTEERKSEIFNAIEKIAIQKREDETMQDNSDMGEQNL